MPLNNGITNTVSISLLILCSLIFVEPEVISHRFYSLRWEISSSGSLRRLHKKCTLKMYMMYLNIFSNKQHESCREHILMYFHD